MEKTLNIIDFLSLRQAVDELERISKPEQKGKVAFPKMKGESIKEEEAIEVSDILRGTLTAVDRAMQKLRGNSGIALGKDPITMQLSGSLVGISPTADRILIRVKPEGKERNDAKR
ncbi:MAG: hypothetical protein KAV87_42560 [Desulfobacteraceae bacterium]|nr:hypothetical protein [Desulfobacteraceae bacterium]